MPTVNTLKNWSHRRISVQLFTVLCLRSVVAKNKQHKDNLCAKFLDLRAMKYKSFTVLDAELCWHSRLCRNSQHFYPV